MKTTIASVMLSVSLFACAEDYDLVIYGGTPAGISAAVQAKRCGLRAVLVEPTRRIGGLTTGGLGRTDIGSKNAFGGIAREFYRDVAAWYRDPKHWTRETRDDFAARMAAIDDKRFVPDEDTMWCFEPSAALAVLEGWERRDGLAIHRGKRLDREKVKVEGWRLKVEGEGEQRRIVSFLTEDGTEYRGKVFIDATYEGDLMAAAGVSYTVGREDNATYGETISGIQRTLGSHKLEKGVDPYVVKGDPSSGVLPGVEAAADDPRPDGSGDRRVQAYCYRMCLTDDPSNRIPFRKPADYDEREYELLFRNVEQGDVKVHRNQGPMPNRKTDTNNDGGFSTDYIGQNWAYPEASYAERERIALRHLNYQRGLMWTLANHPRIPAEVRAEYSKWGTCRDEFAGERGDGWQNQLYVREARRMVGAYVMTEHNCRGHVAAPHPIAYASYTMDSHHCRRYVGKDGFVHNEGDVQDATVYPLYVDGVEQPYVGFRRYGVDYGALVPKKAECANLLVPVCISSSHMAFGSIRMEPVFFSFGQSAAVAAARAIRDGVAVQDVDYAKLREDLAAAGQLLPPAPAARRSEKTVYVRSWGRVRAVCDETAEGDATVRYACATPEIARQLADKRRADLRAFGDEREIAKHAVEQEGNEVVEKVKVEKQVEGQRWKVEQRMINSTVQPSTSNLQPVLLPVQLLTSTNSPSWGEANAEVLEGRLCGTRHESRNGVYDVYLVTRKEQAGAGVEPFVTGRVAFPPPDDDHGWVAAPEHAYAPMETLMFKVPRQDAGSAGLRWLAALAEDEGTPRIGTTVGFCDTIETYRSDAFFQGRPIVREMAENGLELRLYNGWGREKAKVGGQGQGWVESLRQFNALWILIDQEMKPKYDPDEVGEALREYVEQGGGLVIDQTAGRYSESPVDAFWEKAMKHLGMNRLHEEIVDFTNHFWRATPFNWMFYTRNIKAHPVTEGVGGLWCPCRGSSQSMGSVAIDYPKEWEVVVRGEKTAKSYPKNRIRNDIEYDRKGTYDSEPPIVAVRTLGKGRIVSIAVAKDNSGWMYNIDRWPNINERGEHDGLKSDFVRLHENALMWASEPSRETEGFLKPYVPVEMDAKSYRPIAEYDFSREPMRYPAAPPAVKPGAVGVVGLHSNHSDGRSSVADYKAAAQAAGVNFIVFTDPLDKLTAEGLAALRAECAAVTDASFYACPGVEYVDRLGIPWCSYHDKVEYPNAKLYRKGWYDVWNGTNILQRGIYGAQNHYRDGILDAAAFERTGAEWGNLHWFNKVLPYVYEKDVLVADNYRQYLRQSLHLHGVLVSSFTRIRSADDLAAAANASVTCMRTLEDVRRVVNLTGARAHEAAQPAVEFARYGGDIAINGFSKTHVQGTDILRIDLDVSSSDGLADVTVSDCDRRVLARFDPHGAKSFATTFHFLHDKQSYLLLVATDRRGHKALSVPLWCAYYHAGISRCTDNANLLSHRPAIKCQLNWDGDAIPSWKRFYGPEQHNHVSEMLGWEGLERPSLRPTAEAWNYWIRIPLKGIDFPGAEHSASGATRFALDAPNFVGIVDQRIGDHRTPRGHGSLNASYHDGCSLDKDGENPYWRHRRRVYQFVDRIDTFWYFTRRQTNPGYRGGYAVTEGEVEFLREVELAEPIQLLKITARKPNGEVSVFSKGVGRSFGPGAYAAVVSNPNEWYGAFGLAGANDELRANVYQGADGAEKTVRVELGRTGVRYPAGTVLAYRFACGTFTDDPQDGRFLDFFAGMMDGANIPIEVKRGALKGVNGMIELEAAGHVAEAKLGPVDFIQDYPVVIRGLADNGSAVATNGKKWKPLGFESGKAYVECALEPGDVWTFMNLYVADDSDVRFTFVPKMPGFASDTLEVFNPTERAITTTVHDVRRGASFEVTLPAKCKVERMIR